MAKRKTDPQAEEAKQSIGPKDFRIGFYVHDVSRLRRTLFDSYMKPLGITRSQWWVLAQLSRSLSHNGADGMLQTDLAAVLEVGKVTVGGLIDRLEAGGFVERRPSPTDRRAKRVVITERGYEVLEQMSSVGRTLNLSILKGIPKDEVRIAENVLARMKKNIREKLDKDSMAEGGDDES
ncbi:DNA-binding transcriptional regulator, MarR family [Tistlia consotensis]|uniref:Transcriptional regulator, MarR family n=1 Tax=Tistlia consotensis USBA 355 TaxID=560819 RepID=A0A1Y6CJC8_9PROT|nr:MarR family transcriptional regulator [Tistlia consotensis]SMF65905.1 transcriptional regulator, MarR family [Tistlia consotensis USBA 355]SNS02934.1 DNA-binding transcriptional regulator, MarR family [Tistlia consotensis]